jgi:hypothetical protein
MGSILNYACPVWGFSKSKEIECVHYKAIFGVKYTGWTENWQNKYIEQVNKKTLLKRYPPEV